MATKKEVLIKRLAEARQVKAEKAKPVKVSTSSDSLTAPVIKQEKAPDLDIIANPNREIAKQTTVDAMVMGWPQSIQKNAYENRVPEDRIKELLDEALEYQEKADPSGRIEGIQDWSIEKKGRSQLSVVASRPK